MVKHPHQKQGVNNFNTSKMEEYYKQMAEEYKQLEEIFENEHQTMDDKFANKL